MIPFNSLLPLIAGFMSAMLATMSFVLPKTRSAAVGYFGMLAASMAAWAFGAAFLAATSVQSEVMQAMPGELAFWLGILQLLGGSLSTSAWVFFTAAYTGREHWLSGWRRALVLAPFAITMVAGITNPWHGLLLAPPGADGSLSPGPLMVPLVVSATILGPMGMVWLFRSVVESDGPSKRARLVALVVSTLLPIIGSIIWIVWPSSGGIMGVDPVPALFIPLSFYMAYEVMYVGLGDIMPSAERQFFLESSDAIIALDRDMTVLEANPTALSLLPQLTLGSRLESISLELEKHARFCFSHSFEDLTFEATVGGRALWGRVRRASDADFDGCMLLLSDLTQLRTAQRALLARGRTPDGLPATGGYVDRLGGGGDGT